VALAHGQGLAGAEHVHGEEHVVAGLGDLPGARRSGVKARPAHGVEHRLGALEDQRVTAAHEGQGAGLGRGHAAGDRRIDEADAAGCRSLADLARGLRIDGGAVE
jgi:hypothetical protein